MRCPSCGGEMVAGNRFCEACGAPLLTAEGSHPPGESGRHAPPADPVIRSPAGDSRRRPPGRNPWRSDWRAGVRLTQCRDCGATPVTNMSLVFCEDLEAREMSAVLLADMNAQPRRRLLRCARPALSPAARTPTPQAPAGAGSQLSDSDQPGVALRRPAAQHHAPWLIGAIAVVAILAIGVGGARLTHCSIFRHSAATSLVAPAGSATNPDSQPPPAAASGAATPNADWPHPPVPRHHPSSRSIPPSRPQPKRPWAGTLSPRALAARS